MKTKTKPLSIEDKIRLITEAGWPIAFDGCHKLYFLQDDERESHAIESGYEIHSASELARLYERSCSLRFVTRWGHDNSDFDHPWNIEQGEGEDEGEDA